MSQGGYSEKDCSVFVGNLDSRVTEEILWELFLQSGPLENVRIPTDRETGKQRSFGFVEFISPVSANYASQLLDDVKLYGRHINVKPQTSNAGSPSIQNLNQTPQNMQSPLPFSPEFEGQNGRQSPGNYPNQFSEHYCRSLSQNRQSPFLQEFEGQNGRQSPGNYPNQFSEHYRRSLSHPGNVQFASPLQQNTPNRPPLSFSPDILAAMASHGSPQFRGMPSRGSPYLRRQNSYNR